MDHCLIPKSDWEVINLAKMWQRDLLPGKEGGVEIGQLGKMFTQK